MFTLANQNFLSAITPNKQLSFLELRFQQEGPYATVLILLFLLKVSGHLLEHFSMIVDISGSIVLREYRRLSANFAPEGLIHFHGLWPKQHESQALRLTTTY